MSKPFWEAKAAEVQAYLDQGLNLHQIAEIYDVNYGGFRARISELRKKGLIQQNTQTTTPTETDVETVQKLEYKESLEIGHDGTHKSDKLLRMSAEQAKDVDYLLDAHGYDKTVWELITARSNVWNTYSKQDGIMTLYSSKISVRPKSINWSFDQLLDVIKEVKPVQIPIDLVDVHEKRLLEIPLFDAHFGVSDYEYYKPTQSKIYNLLTSRRWEETLFIIGQDMLHNDNFRGQTANGTQIEAVDMPRSWNECTMFYGVLIETAIRQSSSVKIIYSKGNHDESFSWAFVQFLKARYPQVEVDDSIKERKVHVFNKCFIGITHGDKAKKDLINLFPAEFPIEWSQTTAREIHAGHFHREDAKDSFGIMARTLATRNKTDKWHEDNGFVGAHKRFQLFEWSTNELESIHYV